MAKKEEIRIESVLDLNANNVWNVTAEEIAKLWEEDKIEEDFCNSEDKILNIIRLSFEVVHFNPEDAREKTKYDNGDWAIFSHVNSKRGSVAIRKKEIKRITDLSYENIKHISAPLLLELIDRNFGGGWDSIQLSVKDIIESGFEISTTTLPASRLHAAGGTYERKVALGFDVLEVAKGNWVEAIFAKKKEPIAKMRCVSESVYDEDGNLINKPVDEDNPMEEGDEEMENEETFYSSYSNIPNKRGEDDDDEYGGLNIEDGSAADEDDDM